MEGVEGAAGVFFFFQAEDGIRDLTVTGVQTCALPICWCSSSSAGYRFAFVKATQGNYYTNPYFSRDYPAVEAAGMVRSAYHFADPSVKIGRASCRERV